MYPIMRRSDLPAILKDVRKERGATQTEMSLALGASCNRWGKWERGKEVPSRHYRKILWEMFGIRIMFGPHADGGLE